MDMWRDPCRMRKRAGSIPRRVPRWREAQHLQPGATGTRRRKLTEWDCLASGPSRSGETRGTSTCESHRIAKDDCMRVLTRRLATTEATRAAHWWPSLALRLENFDVQRARHGADAKCTEPPRSLVSEQVLTVTLPAASTGQKGCGGGREEKERTPTSNKRRLNYSPVSL